MSRVYLTELFPWLLPIRKRQRLLCFYGKMRLDGRRYARQRSAEPLRWCVYTASCPMYNTATGFDMVYQENKVFNLKLAAARLDGLLIRPGETFSFWLSVHGADRDTPYREGLVERYGQLLTEQGGGLCMLSNLLFWAFLHTPLTVTERHGHTKKDFPEPPSEAVSGVDATVSEGWLDLKVKNETEETYQLHIRFDRENIYADVFSDTAAVYVMEIVNGPVRYFRRKGSIYEQVDVVRFTVEAPSRRVIRRETLYTNRCQIGYALPEDTQIQEEEA